jgi:hypothetical protein
MPTSLQTFIVRVYRRRGLENEPTGVVEMVGSSRQRRFARFEELRAIVAGKLFRVRRKKAGR